MRLNAGEISRGAAGDARHSHTTENEPYVLRPYGKRATDIIVYRLIYIALHRRRRFAIIARFTSRHATRDLNYRTDIRATLNKELLEMEPLFHFLFLFDAYIV